MTRPMFSISAGFSPSHEIHTFCFVILRRKVQIKAKCEEKQSWDTGYTRPKCRREKTQKYVMPDVLIKMITIITERFTSQIL